MIKAVFFDWFDTLAHYEPPREELQRQALQSVGVEITPEKLRRGIFVADKDYLAENARLPIHRRSSEEQLKVSIAYQEKLLAEADFTVSPSDLLQIVKKMGQLYQKVSFSLFDDVISYLKRLKECQIRVGVVTNYDHDLDSDCRRLGLEPYLDFIVTSAKVGAGKPEPEIFLAALEKAGVEASEAIHVGDQYKYDVLGARGVNITPALIDRYGLSDKIDDCIRISHLDELDAYL